MVPAQWNTKPASHICILVLFVATARGRRVFPRAKCCCQQLRRSEHKSSEPETAGDDERELQEAYRDSGHCCSDYDTAVWNIVLSSLQMTRYYRKFILGKYSPFAYFSLIRNMKGAIIISATSPCIIHQFSRGHNCLTWRSDPFDISLISASNAIEMVSPKRNYFISLRKAHSIKPKNKFSHYQVYTHQWALLLLFQASA